MQHAFDMFIGLEKKDILFSDKQYSNFINMQPDAALTRPTYEHLTKNPIKLIMKQ